MVGGEDNQVLVPGLTQQLRNPLIELLQSADEPGHVVAMPPALVELDHVGEEQAGRSVRPFRRSIKA